MKIMLALWQVHSPFQLERTRADSAPGGAFFGFFPLSPFIVIFLGNMFMRTRFVNLDVAILRHVSYDVKLQLFQTSFHVFLKQLQINVINVN